MEGGHSQAATTVAEGIFNIAFGERKRLNLEKIREFSASRVLGFKERTRVLDILQANFDQKVACTKAFVKEVIHFFEEELSLYAQFFKSMGKNSLRQANLDVCPYPTLRKAILELTEIDEAELNELRVFCEWMDRILLVSLRHLLDLYRDETKRRKSRLTEAKDQAESARAKEAKAMEKIANGTDLFESELGFLEKCKASDESAMRWGVEMLRQWDELLEKEGVLKEEVQKKILEFHDKFTKIYNESEASKAMRNFWRSMKQGPSRLEIFKGVLSESEVSSIGHDRPRPLDLEANLEPWIRLEKEKAQLEQFLGIVEVLQSKQFRAKQQVSRKEYVDVVVYFTVDGNVLLMSRSEQKMLLKLKQEGLRATPVSENMLELQGIEVGFFIDSTKREILHFDSTNQAEEFQFFLSQLHPPRP